MEIQVTIEDVGGGGVRVSGMAPFPFSVEGSTKEDAFDKVKALFARRESQGVKVGSVVLPDTPPPWKAFAGAMKDDPLFDDWQAAIAEYRRQRDEEDAARP